MRARELRDLVISALVLALAFGIAFSGGVRAFSSPQVILLMSLMALVGVSSGFIIHELGHRFVARRLGCLAEYTMWPAGLAVALAFSLFGFIFAAPGAVMIYPRADASGVAALSREKSGLISITGPALNMGLAVVFILLDVFYPTLLFSLGAWINSWLALFNLIPFGPFDGAKVFAWSVATWLAAVVVAVALLAVQYLVL